MGFWSFIGELAFFRWLFGEDGEKHGEDRASKHVNQCSPTRNYHVSSNFRRQWQSFAEFHEEQDDYDMMDDF